MKHAALIFAALAVAFAAPAATMRMATETFVTNKIAAATTPSVEIPAEAAERGVTFIAADGTDQNAAVEIGKGARAAIRGED